MKVFFPKFQVLSSTFNISSPFFDVITKEFSLEVLSIFSLTMVDSIPSSFLESLQGNCKILLSILSIIVISVCLDFSWSWSSSFICRFSVFIRLDFKSCFFVSSLDMCFLCLCFFTLPFLAVLNSHSSQLNLLLTLTLNVFFSRKLFNSSSPCLDSYISLREQLELSSLFSFLSHLYTVWSDTEKAFAVSSIVWSTV